MSELTTIEITGVVAGIIAFFVIAFWFMRRGWFGALTILAALLILGVFLLKYAGMTG